jgi:hypothetical protein
MNFTCIIGFQEHPEAKRDLVTIHTLILLGRGALVLVVKLTHVASVLSTNSIVG